MDPTTPDGAFDWMAYLIRTMPVVAVLGGLCWYLIRERARDATNFSDVLQAQSEKWHGSQEKLIESLTAAATAIATLTEAVRGLKER